ncbi:cell wall hydrolase [Emcibacter nanhaiensis]|uniref:Cell wall hydrolase n=2 Tax=Emcibacter nanhaiensis TaxID=1505037 RepID=A0A501PSQ8_9PROT|nr:cell wall hydrolase [Emcibacter nanhaiensis]
MKMKDKDILARTLWGEARGEGRAGMEAVAAVIMNRYNASAWYSGPTIAAVARKKYQFSCWNPKDPNYDKLLSVDETDPLFALALEIADNAIAGKLADPTDGATHYFASYIAAPDWSYGAQQTAKIGKHLFYKGVA